MCAGTLLRKLWKSIISGRYGSPGRCFICSCGTNIAGCLGRFGFFVQFWLSTLSDQLKQLLFALAPLLLYCIAPDTECSCRSKTLEPNPDVAPDFCARRLFPARRDRVRWDIFRLALPCIKRYLTCGWG